MADFTPVTPPAELDQTVFSDVEPVLSSGTINDTCFVFDSGPFTPLLENMTSSTELEVHNVLHYC